ncbi:hypothetical protein HQ520_12000 [bacterium]|nr:hypothetical protein [bacterium]
MALSPTITTAAPQRPPGVNLDLVSQILRTVHLYHKALYLGSDLDEYSLYEALTVENDILAGQTGQEPLRSSTIRALTYCIASPEMRMGGHHGRT